MEETQPILVCLGTRPEEIKLWPFTKYPNFKFLLVNQSPDLHQKMITPDYECEESEIKAKIAEIKPSMVLVHGDTRTAFKSAVAAFESQIPVIHVEAGLRTNDLTRPFPEEGYRRMIDEIATHKYCPTPLAAKNCNGKVVGQTAVDTLIHHADKVTKGNEVIVTVHRNEADIEGISRGLDYLIKKYPQFKFAIYTHPNRVSQEIANRFAPYAHKPLDYPEFVKKLSSCFAVLTDSGGLQEEAAVLSKPYIVLRSATERPEGIHNGNGVMGGMSRSGIIRAFEFVLENYDTMSHAPNPFGKGDAADKIVRDLCQR